MTDYLRTKINIEGMEIGIIYQKATQAQVSGKSQTEFIGSDGKRVEIKVRQSKWWDDKTWIDEMY